MAIIYKQGNLLDMFNKVDVLVNTVNCHGVMGKGIALTFKENFPKMFKEYKKLCDEKKIVVGKLYWYELPNRNKTYESKDLFSEPEKETLCILNFPTKKHWKGKSKLEYIKEGLNSLVIDLRKHYNNISSIAMPPLGCGNGGLEWSVVKPFIEYTFNKFLPNITLYLYEPLESIENIHSNSFHDLSDVTIFQEKREDLDPDIFQYL